MARLTEEQAVFVRGVVHNALDSQRSRSHTKASLVKQCRAAWHREAGQWLNVTAHNIETAAEQLREMGCIIMADPKGQGLRCERGIRNPTPCVGGIIDCMGHEKKVVASRIERQIVRPTRQAGDSVALMTSGQAEQMLEAFKAQTVTLETAIEHLKRLDSRRVVPLLLTEEQAAKVRKMLGMGEAHTP